MVPKISTKFDIMANYNKKLGYHRQTARRIVSVSCAAVDRILTDTVHHAVRLR